MSKHHEFPRMLYKAKHSPITVEDQKTADEHLAQGWSLSPVDASDGLNSKGDKLPAQKDGVAVTADQLSSTDKRITELEARIAKLEQYEPNVTMTPEIAEVPKPVEGQPSEQLGADAVRGTNAAKGITK